MINTRKTGHIYYGRALESAEGSDNCGTCDGANCDRCTTTYTVEHSDERFYSYAEAKAAMHALMNLVIYNGKAYESSGFTIVDGVLNARIHADVEGSIYGKDMLVPCNPLSDRYAKVLEETKQNMDKYAECACTDKHGPHYGNSCDVFKSCNDSDCYWDMKHYGRKEKKWYL